MVHDYYAEVEKLSKKKSEKISTGKLFVIIFILASIVCFCVSIYIGVSGYHFRQNAIPVDAVIVEMADKGDESLEMPLIRYSLDGKIYTAELNMSSSSMHQGKHISVYCNKDNYQDVRFIDDNNFLIMLFVCMGAVYSTFVVLFVLLMKKRS